MTVPVAPAGVVLTGGASRRMGTDKSFVDVDGRPMVVRVAAALTAGGCHLVECQGGDLDRLRAAGLPALGDERPGTGPLAAIDQALRRHEFVVTAACDLPWLDGETVRALVDSVGPDIAASVAFADGRRHLAACWTSQAGASVAAALAAGRRSVMAVFDELDAVDVEVDHSAVRNVNRPGDLR